MRRGLHLRRQRKIPPFIEFLRLVSPPKELVAE